MKRVVSLIASSTEIICALGFEQWLVGRSHECDYPPSITRLPVLTEPKLPAGGTSYQIDERVKAIVQEGLSVYRVDGARLREIRPDIIVTQTHCEVCAVSRRDVEAALCEWTGAAPRIVSLTPDSLADVWADMRRVAAALDAADRGDALVEELQHRMDAVAGKARAARDQPRVACIEWIEPLMAIGNWMPELVDLAGGINLFGTAGAHSPFLTWEQLRDADPDVIAVLPCGFDVARTEQEMPALYSKPGWNELRAVRAGRVHLCDGNAYFNRPGPRLAESLEILARIFHPRVFD